ncbi:DUF3108 domain-containing protein [Desulfurobacterium thermolithotrophum]|nr:DUF3108 domain-containing protein [Desulfurobacterium thermolithotrophum]
MLTKRLLGKVIVFIATVMLCSFSKSFAFEAKLIISEKPSDYDFDGEVLKYRLYWTIFHVANSSSEVKKIDKNHYKISGRVSTAGIAEWFKSIEDKGFSIWNEETKVPEITFLSQREGNYVKDKIYTYDLKKKEIKYIKKKPGEKEKQTKTIKIPFIPFEDIITSVFFFRKYGVFEIGKETVFPLFTGEKFQNVSFKVLSKERISTPLGDIETYKVVPSSSLSPKGAFERRGKVYFWFTADKRHIPVKVVAEVKVGSVSAVLVDAKGKDFDLRKEYEKQKKKSFLEKMMDGNLGGD